MNINLPISELHFVLQISQPPNITQKWFCIQNLHMDISFQKKQTVYKSVYWFPRYKQIQKPVLAVTAAQEAHLSVGG